MSKPKLYAYAVRERGKNQKAIWTRIGAAWGHPKGDGFNLELEALPFNFDGKIVLMVPKPSVTTADTFEGEVG